MAQPQHLSQAQANDLKTKAIKKGLRQADIGVWQLEQ
jgi:hypothetical protein